MTAMDRDRTSRRRFLVMIGVGGAMIGGAAFAACGGAPTSSPTAPAAGPTEAPVKPAATANSSAPAKKDVVYVEWGEDERWMRSAVDKFNEENPDLNLIHQVEPSQQYLEKMVARFRSKVKTDVPQVRDNQFASWAEAGFLQPIDDLPGRKELDADTYPQNLDAMTYKGKRYGLVYYTDYMGFHYNKKIATDNGLPNPPETWDELTDNSVKLKTKGVSEYPVDFTLEKASNSFLMWLFWSMAFGTSGHVFDQNGDPLFPDQDPTTTTVVDWLVNAVRKSKILSEKEVQPSTGMSPFNAGESVYTINASYSLIRWNNDKYVKVPGQIVMSLIPTFKKKDKLPEGTVTWTRMYTIGSYTDVRDEAWRAMYFLGGKNKEGKYWNSLNWLENDFKFTGFKSFRESAEAQAIAKKWGSVDAQNALAAVAKAREALKEPWWTDWDVFHQGEIQAAVLGQKSVQDAVRASAAEARRLKAEFGKK